MVRRCCIVTCRNGSSECDDKVSFFKVPSDQSMYEKWVKVIERTGSEIYKTSAVCERHFRDEDIRREAVLKDHSGNVILQRPLTKVSLTKNAVPSIFDENSEFPERKRRKRRTVIPNYPEDFNTTALATLPGNITIGSDGNIYSNILVTFNENQSNLVNFNITQNSTQSDILTLQSKGDDQTFKNNAENVNGTVFGNTTEFLVNGQENAFGNGFSNPNQTSTEQNGIVPETAKSITIYIKPQGEVGTNVSNVDNSMNQTFNSLDTQQVSQKIPNQLSNFSNLNLDAPKEVTIIVPEEEVMILNESTNYVHGNNMQKAQPKARSKPKRQPAQPKPTVEYHETDRQINLQVFDLIFYNSHKIKLPSPLWGYHKNSIDRDIIIFSKARWFKSNVLIPPIYEKQVIFHENDEIKIYINNKFSPLEVRRPKDITEMEVILKHVDETVVCEGGPSLGECDSAQCAQKDYAVSRWRHKLCPIIIEPGEKLCKFCGTINRVLRYPKKKRLRFGRRPPPSPEREEEKDEEIS